MSELKQRTNKNKELGSPFLNLLMRHSVHHTSLTSCYHPRLLNSIFKSIVHTLELKQNTNKNEEQVSPF